MTSGKTRSEVLNSLDDALRRQASRSVMFHSAVASHLGIAVTDLTCLNILGLDGPRTPGQLADRIGITRGGAVTAMIDRLERAGYVRRTRDTTDRRRVLVELADEAAADTVAPLFAGLGSAVATHLDTYTDAELEILLRMTSGLADTVGRETAALHNHGRPPKDPS